MTDIPLDEMMAELLREDPEFAGEYLAIAVRENTPEELSIVLRQIAAAGYGLTLSPAPLSAAARSVKPAEPKKPARRSVPRSRPAAPVRRSATRSKSAPATAAML